MDVKRHLFVVTNNKVLYEMILKADVCKSNTNHGFTSRLDWLTKEVKPAC